MIIVRDGSFGNDPELILLQGGCNRPLCSFGKSPNEDYATDRNNYQEECFVAMPKVEIMFISLISCLFAIVFNQKQPPSNRSLPYAIVTLTIVMVVIMLMVVAAY